MTKEQIDAIFERAREWPLDRQEDAARMLMMMMEDAGLEPYILSDEERADLREGLAEAERGEFATDGEVEALFARYKT
jgi:predicted transcriptional regulator